MEPTASNYSLREAREADSAAMAHCALTALAANPVSRGLHGPTGTSAAAEAGMQADIARGLNGATRRETDEYIRYVVAEDDSNGVILGFAKWHFYPLDSSDRAFPAPTLGMSASALAQAFFVGGHALRQRNIRGRPCAVITLLAVDPVRRGRGIGAALVDWGLRRADEAGLDAWLVCTPAAHGLYFHCGFRNVEVFDLDLRALVGVEKLTESEDWGEGLASELSDRAQPGYYRAVLMFRKASVASPPSDGPANPKRNTRESLPAKERV